MQSHIESRLECASAQQPSGPRSAAAAAKPAFGQGLDTEGRLAACERAAGAFQPVMAIATTAALIGH